VVEYLTLYKGS